MFHIEKARRLNQQAVISLVNHAIYQFGNSMSLIFLNIYLWRLTNSLFINAVFNLIALLAQAITTFSIGKFAKRKGKLLSYRLGIFITALFYLLILIAQEEIVTFYIGFAIMKGLSQALYWLGYFTIVHEVSTDQNRLRVLGLNTIVMNGTNLSGPAIAGFIIGLYSGFQGYMIVFGAAFVMFAIAAVGSMRLKKEENHHTSYYMKYLPLIFKREPRFKKSMFGWFILGFPHGILSFIPSILLYEIFLKEQTVANLNIVFLSLSIVSSYLISRFAQSEGTVKYLQLSAAGFTFSAVFLLTDLSALTVILFMSIYSIFKPLQGNSYEAFYYNMIGELPLKSNFRTEAVVLRETIINLGRGFGIIIFLIFVNGIEAESIPFVLFALAVVQWFIPYLAANKQSLTTKNRSGRYNHNLR
ncbi:MFS transporter [Bacillus sp. REN16]|uniref:MFS transporter n=1 Tax=Bacillus sp. REN16 TaxID=2887296 RepID=UPI001E3A6500|nr:MFS transporter [Bacillus sp. REN16]MCC3355443.1 MFS transporter [Bacillus sp. REN16]